MGSFICLSPHKNQSCSDTQLIGAFTKAFLISALAAVLRANKYFGYEQSNKPRNSARQGIARLRLIRRRYIKTA